MFIHNLKYSLKIIFKNKGLIFWTFIFPIILGTFFYMAFSNIENSEKLDIINIAVDENIDLNFKSIIENIEHDNNKLFDITYTDSKNAKDMLKANEIIGYLDINKNIMINKNGIDATVFKYVVETIKSNTKIYTDIMSSSSSIDINTIMNNDIKIKVNTVVSLFNKDEYLAEYMNGVDRWKIFKVKFFKSKSYSNKEFLISDEDFNQFLYKNKVNVPKSLQIITEKSMVRSYIIVDNRGNVLDNYNDNYVIIGNLLKESFDDIMERYNFDLKLYNDRY